MSRKSRDGACRIAKPCRFLALFKLAGMLGLAICLYASAPAFAQQEATGCSDPGLTETATVAHLVQRCFSERELLQLKSAINQRKTEFSPDEQKTADQLTSLFGIKRGALDYIFGIVSQPETEPEEFVEKLSEKLTLHRAVVEQFKLRILNEAETEIWPDGLAKVESGQYAQASELVTSAKDGRLFYSAEQAESERLGSLRLAASEALLGRIDLLQSKYSEAIQHLLAASELVTEDEERERVYRESAADALVLQSKDEWNSKGLQQAIKIYRQLLRAEPPESSTGRRVKVQNKLGLALLRYGVGQRSVPDMKEAIAAFEAVLESETKDRDPIAWAMAQSNLAAALFRLGVQEKDAESLQKSVAAYRLALESTSVEQAPEDWVSRQNGLGAALWSLGSQEKTARYLEDAVAAFSEALKGLSASRNPRDWGATQNNLGAALFALAELEQGDEHLKRAVMAFKASLSAYQDASALYFVVGVRNNLKSAEAMLRERQAKSGNP